MICTPARGKDLPANVRDKHDKVVRNHKLENVALVLEPFS